VIAGKDTAFETFTIENMKWLIACAKVYALLIRTVTVNFITCFAEIINYFWTANAQTNI